MATEVREEIVVETVLESKKSKRGFTLTEIAIVLGIIGLILGAIWVAAAAVYTNLRSSKTSTELLNIVQNVRAMYATSDTVDAAANMPAAFGASTVGAASATYLAAGVFPADMLNGTPSAATQATNPWNGLVTVKAATVTTADDSFQVSFNNVPTNACVTIITSTTGNGRDPGLHFVGVGGLGADTTPGTAPPITASVAQGLCSAPGTTSVSLEFIFTLK